MSNPIVKRILNTGSFGFVIGFITGAVVGMSAIIIPGLGPILQGGPMLTLLGASIGGCVGGVTGGIVGGIMGALLAD